MTDVFLKLVNMSISATWLVLAVLLLRLVLKKAPKWVNVLLWGLVAVRLVCPFTLESTLSLVPSSETISPDIMMDASPAIDSGVSFINDAVNPIVLEVFTSSSGDSVNPLQIWIPAASVIWIVGMAFMLIYTAFSYWRLRRKVSTAVLLRDSIYQSEHVSSPFVLGLVHPRVYLPFGMSEGDMAHVIAHEQAHICRKDHWWKPLGFLLLALHWFNPLMWLAYTLLCRDIELACDEKVIGDLGWDQRANYSQALLSCSVKRISIAACPLAFGEVGIRQRIKSVLNYKKPAFWIIAAAVIVCVIVAVCFLTDPGSSYGIGIQDLRVTDSSDEKVNGNWNTVLQLDYLFLEGKYDISMVPEDAGEYLPDGMGEYDGALGKYRIIIEFGDMEPSASFQKKYPIGQVHTLKNVPETFKGELKIKVVHPADHGFVIYVGSDNPFTFKDIYPHKDLPLLPEELSGTLLVPLFNINTVEPLKTRLAEGIYYPVECAYMSQLSSYFTLDPAEDFCYTVTENGFTEHFLKTGGSSSYDVNWQWIPREEAENELAFAKGTLFYDYGLTSNCLYQQLSNDLHLVKDVVNNQLYLIRSGDGRSEHTAIWYIYILVPESVYLDKYA